MRRWKVYLHATLAKQAMLVKITHSAEVVQLTPFIIRYMPVSRGTFGTKGADIAYLRQTAYVMMSWL